MSAPNGVDQRFARFVERIEHADSRSVACLRRGFVFIEKGIVRVLDLVKGSASGYLKDFVRIQVCLQKSGEDLRFRWETSLVCIITYLSALQGKAQP